MRIVIVFESMFGNTARVAEEIAFSLGPRHELELFDVNAVSPADASIADVLIAGAPTHVHSLSRPATRAEAAAWSRDPKKHVTLRPEATGIGMREWLEQLPASAGPAAAFDTRAEAPKLITGSAARHIAHLLHERGRTLIGDPGSFLVAGDSRLSPGERARVREWALDLDNELVAPVEPANR